MDLSMGHSILFNPQMSMKLSSNEAWWAKLAIKHGKIVLNS